MKIHKRLHEEGTVAILITLAVIAVTVFLVNWLWPSQTVWHYLLYAFELVVLVLTVRFFRVPIWRKTTIAENAVLSPADGIVAANEEVLEDEYFHEKRRQLSIFMSIYDVHINFFPFDGEVTYYKYHPGKFLLAFNPKSSTDNEHNTIILKDTKGREILVRQIAGFVARRIVCALEPGDQAVVGEELGMIRFGSRVDVFLPLDAEIKVKIGDKTTGKETVLATLK
ncbi:MAG: phosphatidylserine decarboxylase family protein [Bacteroidales bacterium]|jgi:phosphatidylserine decarboxylase|nr:phosphatidylserine decarboxylase family protein [Bacteroidales bacterium]